MDDPFDPPATASFGAAVAPFVVVIGTGIAACALMFLALVFMGPIGGAAGFLGAAVGLGGGIAAVVLAIRAGGGLGWLGAGFGTASTLFWGMVGVQMVTWATTGFARGRQLRERGVLRLAPMEEGSAWVSAHDPIAVPDALRDGLAAAWRENGRTEHASVAAFARVSLELVALGAPPELLACASRDTLDEIRHTELCFGLARAIDGRDLSPGPFPEARTAGALQGGRTARLVGLAVTSLVDGALHEGLSARVIAKLARRCELEPVRAVLVALAADEGRHAAHGWDVVEWCVAAGGAPVCTALRAAAGRIPAAVHGSLPAGAEDGSLERYGLVGRALEAEQYALARAQVVARLARLLDAAEQTAAA